jgi:hypothetical protein
MVITIFYSGIKLKGLHCDVNMEHGLHISLPLPKFGVFNFKKLIWK